jgi:hypothetical protein
MDPRIIKPVIADDDAPSFEPRPLYPPGPNSRQCGLHSRSTRDSSLQEWLHFLDCLPPSFKVALYSFETSGTTHPPSERYIPEHLNHLREILFLHHHNYHGAWADGLQLVYRFFTHILHSTLHLKLGLLLWSKEKDSLFLFPSMPYVSFLLPLAWNSHFYGSTVTTGSEVEFPFLFWSLVIRPLNYWCWAFPWMTKLCCLDLLRLRRSVSKVRGIHLSKKYSSSPFPVFFLSSRLLIGRLPGLFSHVISSSNNEKLTRKTWHVAVHE